MAETGREDDQIYRGDAIRCVSDHEYIYPSSLWHLPPAQPAPRADPEAIDRIAEGVLSRYRNSITRKAFEEAVEAIKALL